MTHQKGSNLSDRPTSLGLFSGTLSDSPTSLGFILSDRPTNNKNSCFTFGLVFVPQIRKTEHRFFSAAFPVVKALYKPSFAQCFHVTIESFSIFSIHSSASDLSPVQIKHLGGLVWLKVRIICPWPVFLLCPVLPPAEKV